MKSLEKYRGKLFLLFLLLAVIGWWGRDNFKSALPVAEILRDPIQKAVASNTPIVFQKDGFSYSLAPLYDYDIAGLVMHRLTYNQWYSLTRTDEVFTADLCLAWGKNITDGAYKNKSLSVKQDFRFCLYQYWDGVPIENSAMSNNHMVVIDPAIQKKIDSVSAGDQVRIIGKLVNVKATALGATKTFEGKQMEWTTSTIRTDSSGGACEIIYVQDVQILSQGNRGYWGLYTVGVYGMWAVALLFVMQFIYEVINAPHFKP